MAPQAQVTVSGNRDIAKYPPAFLTDGKNDLRDNSQRWLSDTHLPHSIEFEWDSAQTIIAARIVSGYFVAGNSAQSPIATFRLQYAANHDWQDIPGAVSPTNSQVDWPARFSPVTTTKIRLLITGTHQNFSRIWEVELFDIP